MWDFGRGMSFRVSAKRVVMPDGSRFEGVGTVPLLKRQGKREVVVVKG